MGIDNQCTETISRNGSTISQSKAGYLSLSSTICRWSNGNFAYLISDRDFEMGMLKTPKTHSKGLSIEGYCWLVQNQPMRLCHAISSGNVSRSYKITRFQVTIANNCSAIRPVFHSFGKCFANFFSS